MEFDVYMELSWQGILSMSGQSNMRVHGIELAGVNAHGAVDVRLYVQLGRVSRSLAYIEVIIHEYLISYAGVSFGGGGNFLPPLHFPPPGFS